ncbi:MAG TPA: type II toxin-antitoxin system HicA family toxin [Xenococcaceae cyanobacterium]
MAKLPVVSGSDIIKTLEKIEFKVIRQKGSHIRMKHEDNRVVTIPVHGNKSIGRGLLRKVLRDAELTVEEFQKLL